MRQLVYTGPGRVGWEEAADPELTGSNGAIVRPLAVARCDLDSPMIEAGLFPGPFAVGHEAVAEVVEVGPEVTTVKVGQRVAVPFQPSCGACPDCLGTRFAACERHRTPAGGAFGFGPAGGSNGGAVADLLAVAAADHLLLPVPGSLPNEVLCTLPDNVVDAYRAVAPHLRERPEAEVLVVGGLARSIGLYAVAWAVALGSERVRYIDTDADRGAAAAGLGATVTLQEGPWPRRFDRSPITVENTGCAEGLACTLRSTARYGTCTCVAIHFTPTTEVPLLEMYTNGITLHASRADSRRFLPEVIQLVEDGRMDPAHVPTWVVDWDDADRAWLEPATKLVVAR